MPNFGANTLVVVDRDYSGQRVQLHSATQASAWVFAPARHLSYVITGVYPNNATKATPEAPWPTYPEGPFFAMDRTDGYSMAGISIQGVRAYDPSVGQWTTPDAYQGDVHDPSSQRSYMWNGNNPVAYSDPSGYIVEITGGTVEQQQQIGKDINQLIHDSKGTPAGSLASQLGKLLSSNTVNAQVNIASDSGNTGLGGANIANLNRDSWQMAKCTCNVTVHWGAVPAADADAALKQGLANDIGSSYAWRGMMGPTARGDLGHAVRLDGEYISQHPGNAEGTAYDLNQDKWANSNILEPLNLGDDK